MIGQIKGFLQDYINQSDIIYFYSWEPLIKSRDAVYDDVSIRGRSEPHVFYSHTSAKTVPVTLHFAASMDQDDGGQYRNIREIENFVESLSMPDYGSDVNVSSVVDPPHLARLKIKKLFDGIGTVRGYSCTDIPPYDIDTGLPQMIDISFTFHIERFFGKPLGYAEIRKAYVLGQTSLL